MLVKNAQLKMIQNKSPKLKHFTNFKSKQKSLNRSKAVNLPNPVSKISKIKTFLEDFESKFKKDNNYKRTSLKHKIELSSNFRKPKNKSIVSKMNSLQQSLLKMKGSDDVKHYSRNKLIFETVSKLRNSVELCKGSSLTSQKLEEVQQCYKHSSII